MAARLVGTIWTKLCCQFGITLVPVAFQAFEGISYIYNEMSRRAIIIKNVSWRVFRFETQFIKNEVVSGINNLTISYI